MKKIITIIFALVLFANLLKAETIITSGHYSSKIYDFSVGVQYKLSTDVGKFYFTILGVNEAVLNHTYTLVDMNFDYSFAEFSDGSYVEFTMVNFTMNVANKEFNVTAVCNDGNTYNITIAPLEPITTPSDTIFLTMSNAVSNRVIDYTATQGSFQLVGATATNDYTLYFAVYSNVFAGIYSDDDLFVDYSALYDAYGNEIELNNLQPSIVTGNANNCTATVKWVSTDSTLYVITFSYANPIVQTQMTFSATNLTITKNADYALYLQNIGIYTYDFEASNGIYILRGTVYNVLSDDAFGTWNFGNGDIGYNLYDAITGAKLGEPFSGTITIARNGSNTITLTGTSLHYGNVQWTFNVSNASTANHLVTISVDQVTSTSITCSFDKKSNCSSYYIVASEPEVVNQYIGTRYGGSTIEETIELWGIKYTSDATYTWTGMKPNTLYVIYVTAKDANGTRTLYTDTVITSLKGGHGTSVVTISVTDFTSSGAKITVTPNDQTMMFKDMVIYKTYYDQVYSHYFAINTQTANQMTNDSIFRSLMDDPYEYYEEDQWIWDNLEAGTEYMTIAAGMNADSVWGAMKLVTFKTLGGDDPYNPDDGGTTSGRRLSLDEVDALPYVAYTEEKTIVLIGAEGQTVAVYDVAGRLICNLIADMENVRIAVPAAGVYMVRINNVTLRAVVR